MSHSNGLIEKISDYLQSRDKQTNFGECRRCDKKVYWSTSKIASHIRSGHCQGAPEEEVQQFKQEFIYDSPKNLVHKSALSKKFKESFEVKKYRVVKPLKRSARTSSSPNVKKPKRDSTDEDQEQQFHFEAVEDESGYSQVDESNQQNVSIMILPNDCEENDEEVSKNVSFSKLPGASQSNQELSREDKFINAVYPQYKGRTKLQLIEDIIELKRLNELLQTKAKTYENTINRLLN